MRSPDLKQPLVLDKSETTLVGDRVSVVHAHVSVFPEPTLHIGFAFGTAGEPGRAVRTVALPVKELVTRFPGNGPALAQAIRNMIDGAYAVLLEAGVVGSGVRA